MRASFSLIEGEPATDPDPNWRAAWHKIAATMSAASLLPYLRSDDPFDRARAAALLKYGGWTREPPPEPSAEMVEVAALLVGMLGDATALVAAQVDLSSWWIPEPTAPGREAASALLSMGVVDAALLLEAYGRATTAFELANIAAVLRLIPEEQAVSPLVELLAHENASVRQAAAASLGKLRAKGALAALIAALDGAYADTPEIIAALLSLNEPAAMEAVLHTIRAGTPHQRSNAAVTLAQNWDRVGWDALTAADGADWRSRAVEALTAALQSDPGRGVRLQVARYLDRAEPADDRILAALLAAATDDPFPGVRAAALASLGRYLHPETARRVELLVSAMADGTDEIRHDAARGAAALIAQRQTRHHAGAVVALKRAFMAALSDPEGWVRIYALDGLQTVATSSDARALAQAVIADPSQDVRFSAAEVLGHIEDVPTEAIRALDAALGDPDVPADHREEIIRALLGAVRAPRLLPAEREAWWREHRAEYLD